MIRITDEQRAAWKREWTPERKRMFRLERLLEKQSPSSPAVDKCWEALMTAYFQREKAKLPANKQGKTLPRWLLLNGWARLADYHLDDNFHVKGFTFHEEKPEGGGLLFPAVLVKIDGEWRAGDGIEPALNMHPAIRILSLSDRHRMERRDAFEIIQRFLGEHANPFDPWTNASRLNELLNARIAPPWFRQAQDYDAFWEMLRLAISAGAEVERQRMHLELGKTLEQGDFMRTEGLGKGRNILSERIDQNLKQTKEAGHNKPSAGKVFKALRLRVSKRVCPLLGDYPIESDEPELAKYLRESHRTVYVGKQRVKMKRKGVSMQMFRQRVKDRLKIIWGI